MQHRYAWCYLVGFVHPGSGRTVFHLASAVSIELFEAELAAFAQQVGAGPHKQIVLVLDCAGWHTSVRLRVPDHVHLLFLPPYSPELQPAEHLLAPGLLTNTVLLNRHVATIDELEDVQAQRCVAVQARLDLIRSTTLFHWWPQRIKKRQGPRRNWYKLLAFGIRPGSMSREPEPAFLQPPGQSRSLRLSQLQPHLLVHELEVVRTCRPAPHGAAGTIGGCNVSGTARAPEPCDP